MSYNTNRGTTYTATDRSSRTDSDSISAANRDANNRSQDLDAVDRAANNVNNRTVNLANQLSNVNRFNDGLTYDRQNQSARDDRAFKASEAQKDRDAAKGNAGGGVFINKEVAQREDIKAVNDRNFAMARDAASAGQQKDLAMSLADTNNAAQQRIANTSQQTAFGEQAASVKRAQENARAQVSAALFGSSRQYTGY